MPRYVTTQVKFELTAIIPKDLPDKKLNTILNGYKKYFKGDLKRTLLSDMQDTVEEWHDKPTFEAVYAEPYGNIVLTVRPYGYGKLAKQWRWISGGVAARTINSSKGPMVFQTEYIPATDPDGLRPNRQRVKYGPWRKTMTVHNHEIKARRFSRRIKEKREKEILAQLFKIRNKALRGMI